MGLPVFFVQAGSIFTADQVIAAAIGGVIGFAGTLVIERLRHTREREAWERNQESDARVRRMEAVLLALDVANRSWAAAIGLRGEGGEREWESALRDENTSTAHLRMYAPAGVTAFHTLTGVTRRLAQEVREHGDIETTRVHEFTKEWRAARDEFMATRDSDVS